MLCAEIRNLYRIGERILSSLDNLTTEVADVKSVMASAATLIGGFSARLDAAIAAAKAGDDSAALDSLSADLKSSADALAAAVTANTPAAAPSPAPVESPAPDAAPAPDGGTSTDQPTT